MPAIAVAASYDLQAVSLPDTQDQWQRAWRHSHSLQAERARITVAGQWRVFTALPEHSVAKQGDSGATGEG
jgi:hypothetical protein